MASTTGDLPPPAPSLLSKSTSTDYLSDDLIEGIGNEVLLSVIVFAAIFILLLAAIKRYENVSRVSRIHPSNLIAVTDARTQQQQNRSGPSVGEANGHHSSDQHQASFIPGTRTRFGTMDGNCPVCLNTLHLPIETNCGHLFCGRCIVIYWQHAQWRGGPIRCPVCRQQVNILLPCFATHHANSSASSPTFTETITNATSDLLSYLLSFIYNQPARPPPPAARTQPPSQSTPSSNGVHSSATFRGAAAPDDLLNGTSTAAAPTPDPNAERSAVIREIHTYNRRFSGEPRPWSDYLYDLPTLLRHLTNDFFSFNGLLYMFRVRILLCVVAAIMYLISPLDMIPEAVFGIFGLFDDIVVLLLLAIYVTIIYRRFLSSRWEMD